LVALRAPGVNDQLFPSISDLGAAKSQYSASLLPLKLSVKRASPACALSWLGGGAELPLSPQAAKPKATATKAANTKHLFFVKIKPPICMDFLRQAIVPSFGPSKIHSKSFRRFL
jgi:hypothetical protein